MENLVEKPLSRQTIYDGTVLRVVCDRVLLPNGCEATREFCLHNGAVCILPLTKEGEVLMERQYRHAHGRVFFEIPAGKLDSPDEDPLSAAKRELREETGICADPAALRLLGRRARRNTIVETYLYLLPDGDVELKLQPEEVIDAKWAEYREVAEHPDMVRNIRESFALYKHILAQAQPRE